MTLTRFESVTEYIDWYISNSMDCITTSTGRGALGPQKWSYLTLERLIEQGYFQGLISQPMDSTDTNLYHATWKALNPTEEAPQCDRVFKTSVFLVDSDDDTLTIYIWLPV